MHNISTESPEPSAQAHRSIIKESVCSAWDLFIDESILRHIQRCNEEEAQKVLQTENWRVSLHKLDAFLAIVYHVELTKQLRSKYINCGIGYGEFKLFLKLWRATDSLK